MRVDNDYHWIFIRYDYILLVPFTSQYTWERPFRLQIFDDS